MLLSPRKNGLTSLFKEVRVFKEFILLHFFSKAGGVEWQGGGVLVIPSKTRVLRQIAPESSPERLARSLSHSFFVVPSLSPNDRCLHALFPLWCAPNR